MSSDVQLETLTPDVNSVASRLALPPERGLAAIVVDVLTPARVDVLQEVLAMSGRTVPVVALVTSETVDLGRGHAPHSLVLVDHPERSLPEFASEIVTYWITHNVRPQGS